MRFRRLIKLIRGPSVSSRPVGSSAYQSSSPSKARRLRGPIPIPRLSHKASAPDALWQARARERLRDLLGISESLVPTVEDFEDTKIIMHSAGYIRKGNFIDSAGVSIPAYIGSPREDVMPTRWMICLQGHSSGMHISLGLDQAESTYLPRNGRELDIASQALAAGFGIICIEQYSLGMRQESELTKIAPHPCQDAAMQSILLGHTLTGIRVAESLRIVSFLRESGIINGIVGFAGNSMGGTISMYAAALDDSIDFAIPSSCTSTLEQSLLSLYHCTDLYIPRLASYFDTQDILALIAPRSLIIAQGVCDPIFPLSGLRDVVSDLEEVYRFWGAPNRFQLVLGSGGHKFYGTLIFPELARMLSSLDRKP